MSKGQLSLPLKGIYGQIIPKLPLLRKPSRLLSASILFLVFEGMDLGDHRSLRFQVYVHDRTCFLIPM